jgi:molybdate transport system substrate-binding protein
MVRVSSTLSVAIACMAVALSAGGQQRPAANRQVVVSAAVSLTEVLQQLAPVYQQKTGDQVVLNLGASNTLARQIRFSAGVDLFISADEAQMDAVAAQIDPATRIDLLSNQLAIAVPDDRPRTMKSARELLDPAIRRIAIGDPAGVPAGVYAKQYLQSIGIWPDLAMKIVPSGSVRLALAAVESGAADAAIVYHTDVAMAAHARESLLIPAGQGPRIVYPAALVRAGHNPEGARRFLAFLQTPEAAAVFTHAGFVAAANPKSPIPKPKSQVFIRDFELSSLGLGIWDSGFGI